MLATFTTAAKEELLSSFVPWSADECICAFESQGKKVHQGVAPQNLALHQGIAWSNSTTALGLRGAQLETRVRSRCTGKERDAESNLDMFGARYYGSSLGRFMTPDWAVAPTAVPYAHYGNPQSLNLYSYVENNPTTTGDPDGHDWASNIVYLSTAAGTFGGALIGGTVGAGAGTLALPGGGTVGGGYVGGAFGAGVGAGFGVAVGNAIVNTIKAVSSSNESTPAPASSTTPAPASTLPDDANVVRGGSGAPGGANSPEGIAKGTGTHPSGITGFSAESAPGKSVEQLAAESPAVSGRNHVGCCTVGQVRAAGGDVIPTSGQSPNHATVTGLSPTQASGLLTPTVPNPAKVKPND